MALERPVVEIYQQYADPTPTPVEVDLTTFIVGPAYHIRDYDTDGAELLVGAYGDPSAASDGVSNGRPLPLSVEHSEASPPDNAVGALLDPDSVQVIFEDPYIELATGSDGARNTLAPDENEFTSAAGTFVSTGIQAGDRLVITDDAANTVVRIVKEVESETVLRTFADMAAADFPGGTATGMFYRIERQVATQAIDAGFVSVTGQRTDVLGGVTMTDGVGATLYPVASASIYIEYRSLRQDLAQVKQLSSRDEILSVVGRIDERNPLAVALSLALANGPVVTKYYGTNGDDLSGGAGGTALDAHTRAKDDIENVTGIYAIVPLSQDPAVIGMWDASVAALAAPASGNFRVVLACPPELSTSLVIGDSDSATGTAEMVGDSIIFATLAGSFVTDGVRSGDNLVLLDALAGGAPREVVRVIDRVLGETVLSLTAAFGPESVSKLHYIISNTPPTLKNLTDVVLYDVAGVNRLAAIPAPASPEQYIGNIVRITGMSVPALDGDYLITAYNGAAAAKASLVYDGVTYTAVDDGALGNLITIQIIDDGTTPLSISVVGGTDIVIRLDGVTNGGTHTSTEVVAALTNPINASYNAEAAALVTAVNTAPGTPQNTTVAPAKKPLAGGLDNGWSVYGAHDVSTSVPASGAPSTGTGSIVQALHSVIVDTAHVTRQAFARLYDPSAAFLSDSPAVVPTDLVEQPAIAGDYTSAITSTVIEAVLSDSRLTVLDGYELAVPNVMDTGPDQAIPSYRINRELDKAGIVDQLVLLPPTYATSRLVLVWPPLCDVSGVEDARTGVQNPQPGYYLAAAVGGAVGALPPHQPLTRASLSGFDDLYYSNYYFNRAQIDDLLAAGYFVHVQNSRGGLPSVLRQVTTKVDSLEEAELSIVKVFDYVALKVKASIDKFIGTHNITEQTIEFVRSEIISVLKQLKSQRRPRIGSPVLDYGDVVVTIPDGLADTLDVTVDVTLPKPLNKVRIYLRGN